MSYSIEQLNERWHRGQGFASEEITRLCAKVENLCQQTRDAFVDGVFFALEGYPTDKTIEDWRNEAKSRWPHPASCQRS